MSQSHVPRSSCVVTRPETDLRGHPKINASSHRVVSARERRERLLAYHTAVRLLENCGLRPRANTTFGDDSGIPQHHEVSSFFGVVEHSTAAFGSDPVLERVQQAVAAYEEEHQRQMHEAISLNFVDDRGNLVDLTPASTPRSGLTSPRARASRQTPPNHRRANAEMVAKVREVLLSGGGFSFFDAKKKQLLTSGHRGAECESTVPGSSIMPATQMNIVAMKEKVNGIGSSVTNPPMFSPAVPNLELPQFGKPTVDSLLSLGISLQLPGEGSQSKIPNPFERLKYSDAEAAAARELSTARLKQCIANTARMQTFPEYRATTSVEPEHPDRDPREWLSHHPSVFQAVRATTDLVLMTLMKALPVCLFAGDDMRFAELLAEEYLALHQAAASAAASITPATSAVAQAPGTPTIQRTLAAQCDEAMLDLQQRSSQRAERALSHANANRLFLLLEVEQARSDSHLCRLRYTAPAMTTNGAPSLDLGGGRIGGGAAKQLQLSGTLTGSTSRRAETIEIERERRKREAKRPPRDPLQAAASQNHCWLSLTTSKMKQMPLHACALDSAVAGEASKPTEGLSGSLLTSSVARDSSLRVSTTPRSVAPRSPSSIADASRGKPDARIPSAESRSTAHSTTPRISNRGGGDGPRGGATSSSNNTSTFAYPESTILPVVDLMVALASSAAGHGEGGSPAEFNLQERLGPVELRLLLEISDAYAALVQSLHVDRGSIYGRFLEQHRDHLLRAASEVIAQASLEYMTHFIASKDGTRGLYRPAVESTTAALQPLLTATAQQGQQQSPPHSAGSILATLRPFGRRVALSKPQVEAILSATGHRSGSGEVLVGNDRDAQRAAIHQLEQNRSVLHEVLARVKGELLFLLTGVDSRTRILEKELIAIEEHRRERAKTRKLRETSSAAGWRHSEALVGHTVPHLSSRQPRGVDMIGPTNKVRFRALLDDMVGSSSEEDEALQDPASGEDAELIPPVFDWQRQNYDALRSTKRRYYSNGESPSRGSPVASPSRLARPSHEHDRSPSNRADMESSSPRTHRGAGHFGSRYALKRPRALSPSALGSNGLATAALQNTPESVAARTLPVASATTTSSPRVAQLLSSTKASETHEGQECKPTPNSTLAPPIPPTPPTSLSTTTPKVLVPVVPLAGRNKRVSLVLGDGLLPRSIEQAKAESAAGATRDTVHSISPRSSVATLVATIESTPEEPVLTPLQTITSALLPRPPAQKTDALPPSATARPNKTRALKGLMLGMASTSTQHNAPPPSQSGEKAKMQVVRVPDNLTMVALQRELLVLERNRRRASRSAPAGSRSPSPKKGLVTTEGTESLQAPASAVAVTAEASADYLSTKPNSLTEQVVGPQHAVVVEKFKQACSATIQHLYGATAAAGKNEGSAWYEQGRPCTAARSERVSAVRGMQRGRFDLAALTPIAALRLAVSNTVDSHGAVKDHQQPTITYATHHHHHAGTSHELPWTV